MNDEGPREGSVVGREPDSDRRAEPERQEPGRLADAPNNRSTPESAPTGEALTDEQEREAFASAMAPRGYKCRWSSLDGWDNTNVFHAWNGWSAARAALSTHPSAPVAPAESPEHDHEKFDAIAADRYKVVPTKSGFWGYAVVVGDSAAEVYKGHKRDCDLVARRMAGAFLDGAFLASRPPAVQPVAPAGWQPIETAPKDGRKLILFYRNSNGKARTVMAKWVTDDEAAETDADGIGLEGGWYECIDNWDDYCQVAIHEGEPTHWMPLPATPSAEAQPTPKEI